MQAGLFVADAATFGLAGKAFASKYLKSIDFGLEGAPEWVLYGLE